MRALATLLFAASVAVAQSPRSYPPDVPMPAYKLPALLTCRDGSRVTTAEQWRGKRRPELLELFRQHVYGRVPATSFVSSFKLIQEDKAALGGAATRKEIDITITQGQQSLVIRLRLFTPNAPTQPVPAFLLINNRGNEVIDGDWARKSEFWPVEQAIARGFALAAFNNCDVDPDKHDDFRDGIHALLDVTPRGDDAWGTLGAWAWGASRCLDYLVTDPRIAKDQVAVIGHSRGGKTALWAGAQDERFALVISNDSGCGGAALNRRRFQGREQIARITTAFPHWFCEKFRSYADRENDLPVDQHQLLALMAPRALAVGSAFDDKWADPRGEFLSLHHAEPAFALFGKKGLGSKEIPAADQPLHGDGLHYHLRTGKHDLTLADWHAYWDFADRTFSRASR